MERGYIIFFVILTLEINILLEGLSYIKQSFPLNIKMIIPFLSKLANTNKIMFQAWGIIRILYVCFLILFDPDVDHSFSYDF